MKLQDDEKRFPLYHRVKKDHDINIYVEEQNKSMYALGYTERMLLCRKAARFLNLDFHLIINEQTLM